MILFCFPDYLRPNACDRPALAKAAEVIDKFSEDLHSKFTPNEGKTETSENNKTL